MGTGRAKIDFSDGYFSDNIIAALHKCPAKVWLGLKAKGLLRFNNTDYVLSHTSFTMEGLDEYAEAAGCRVADFVFTDGYEQRLIYTAEDSFVLAALDQGFTDTELQRLSEWISRIYPNQIYDSDVKRVPSRLQLVLSLLPYGSLSANRKLQSPLGQSVIQQERVAKELERFRKTGYGASVVLDSNIYPDLAMLSGVSLHWILNLKTPLYCKTQIAEEIFDRYTLMQPHEQVQFLNYLEGLLSAKGDSVQSILELRKR